MTLSRRIEQSFRHARRVTRSEQVRVTIEPWIGYDDNGEMLIGTSIRKRALVADVDKRFLGPDGETVTATSIVQFMEDIADNGATDREEPIDPRDRIVLPSGVRAGIVRRFVDRDPRTGKARAVEVWLG